MLVAIFTAGNEILRMSKDRFSSTFLWCVECLETKTDCEIEVVSERLADTKTQDLQQEWKYGKNLIVFLGGRTFFFERSDKISHKATCYRGTLVLIFFGESVLCHQKRPEFSFLMTE